LPNVKELQSLVDYTRSPATSNSAAINPLLTCSQITDEGGKTNYPFYWSGTTHADMKGGSAAAYVAFGEALGWMQQPPNSGNYNLLDVHGAGAQRSDPKTGNPADYPHGQGPQGDVRRIYNYVRLVRDIDQTSTAVKLTTPALSMPDQMTLLPNYPNPFNPGTTITFELVKAGPVTLKIYNLRGELVETLVEKAVPAGQHAFQWNASNHSSGVYYYQLTSGSMQLTRKMLLVK
jgi:hypothetical protein